MKSKMLSLAALSILMLSACSFEVSVSDDKDGDANYVLYTVASIENSGGMCINGECHSHVKVLSDGQVLIESGNVHKMGSITREEVKELVTAIEEIDMSSLPARSSDYTCPTAYDGQKTEFTFYDGTKEIARLDSCEVDPSNLEAAKISLRVWEDTLAK